MPSLYPRAFIRGKRSSSLRVLDIPRPPDRIALISDIHGNLTALEAVLKDIGERGITRIFNLGDLIGKGPRGAAVVDRCREVCDVTVQGNWDAEIATADDAVGQWHRRELGPERLRYLSALPGCVDVMLSGRSLRLYHASEQGVFIRVYETEPRDRHRAMFDNTAFTGSGAEPQIVAYGDIHTAYLMNFDGRTLINAGSVGNALDMPGACYVVLEGELGATEPGPWSASFIRIPYDIEGELAVAEAMGMPKFAEYRQELRTAVYRGHPAASA